MRGRGLAALFALAIASATGAAVAADATPGSVIQYAESGLTVRLAHVPLAEVLAEIGRQTSAEIRGELGGLGDASAEFEAVPLPAALHRLLGDQSFALVYGAGGQLRAIRVLRASDETGTTATRVAASVPPPTPMPVVDHSDPGARWADLIVRHPPVRVSSKLASVLGADTVSLKDLLSAMVANGDADVRSEAQSAGMHLLATDSEMRAALLDLRAVLDAETTSAVSGGKSWRRLLVAAAGRGS